MRWCIVMPSGIFEWFDLLNIFWYTQGTLTSDKDADPNCLLSRARWAGFLFAALGNAFASTFGQLFLSEPQNHTLWTIYTEQRGGWVRTMKKVKDLPAKHMALCQVGYFISFNFDFDGTITIIIFSKAIIIVIVRELYTTSHLTVTLLKVIHLLTFIETTKSI